MAPTLTSEAWTQIRFDYEHTERPIPEICAEHGISSGTLRDRMRRWNWTRRRPPIPREGPPPLPAPRVETQPLPRVAPPLPAVHLCAEVPSTLDEGSPHPAASRSQVYAGCASLPAALGVDPPPPEPAPGRAQARPGWEGEGGEAGATCAAPSPPVAAFEDALPNEIDDGALVPRLKGAVARVLPAIEAIVARLAAGSMHPREMERAGRALGVLTRTLRELNALLGERQPPVPAADAADSGRPGTPADNDDGGPRDMEEFRQELIRRMNAIVAARKENAAQDASAGSDPGATAEGEAGGPGEPLPSPRDAESGDARQSGRELPRGPQVRSL